MESKKIELLPHNEEALSKLKKCLENNQLVAINHATGTGKSFIILKYLYENRDKRILFLSPSYPINSQLLQEHAKELGIDVKEFKKIDTLIYSNLLKMDMEELANNYDIVVLDEYHRCGAKKWGIKVNELLDHVKSKYPKTKVIGTTATEIRYLDNERNMNNILFDGVCASTLTLADAMLNEILPVPIYINSLIELTIEYEKAEKRVRQKSLYDRERDYYLKLIEGVRHQIDEIINADKNIKKYIKKDGKHLVFSSTIDSIGRDRETINKLLECNHEEYIVHSRRSKEANEKALNGFRNGKKPATLYCVNILNEGVHVKDVDSIFMLRPTKSPIIFFQQLGRLLSYSRRKDKVVVFDLVNNVKQNPYILSLYLDLYKRAEELSKTDPNNKERYLNVLDRFEIVNIAGQIYEKLNLLNNALSNQEFYRKRIDFAIEILQGKGSINEVEVKMVKMDLLKYYKYITLEQFRIIKHLDIIKPSIFNLSEDEFIELLDGEKNIYEKNKKFAKQISDRINAFYEKNGYFPSLLGKSAEECEIAEVFMRAYDYEEKDRSIFKDKKLTNLSEYEKIIYGVSAYIDYDLLYSEIDILIEKHLDISSSILCLIQSQDTKTSKIYFDKILKYNSNRTKNEIDRTGLSTQKMSTEELTNLELSYKHDYEEIAKECMTEVQKYGSTEEYLEKFSEEFTTYIKETKRMPVYVMPGIKDYELKKMRTLYVKKMIFYSELQNLGYINLFDETYNFVQMEIVKSNKIHVLDRLVQFLKGHNGDMPSSKIETDRKLALEFNKIKSILTDEDVKLISSYRLEHRTSEVVIKYVNFVKTKRRYPLINSTNEEEIALLNEYTRNEPYFSDADKKMISELKKSISSRVAMQNAYIELLKRRERNE